MLDLLEALTMLSKNTSLELDLSRTKKLQNLSVLYVDLTADCLNSWAKQI